MAGQGCTWCLGLIACKVLVNTVATAATFAVQEHVQRDRRLVHGATNIQQSCNIRKIPNFRS